jgi:hypothetical protein
VRQDYGASHNLIGLAWIDVEARGDLDGFVELRERDVLYHLDGLIGLELGALRQLGLGIPKSLTVF